MLHPSYPKPYLSPLSLDRWRGCAAVCRLIYNDLQGRNQVNVVQHIAEEGQRARKNWSSRARAYAHERGQPPAGAPPRQRVGFTVESRAISTSDFYALDWGPPPAGRHPLRV